MPTLAVAAVLKEKLPKAQFLYVGRAVTQERELVESQGFKFIGISTGKLRRYFSVENAVDLFKFGSGLIAANKIVAEFKPDVVFAKGGYVTLPIVIAAGRRGIPVVIHESDSTLGLANRLALKWANTVTVSFPVEEYFKNNPGFKKFKSKFVFTGLPVTPDLFKTSKLKLFKSRKPLILISGGSQGSGAINRAVWGGLSQLLGKYTVAHQTGLQGIKEAERIRTELDLDLMERYFIFDFARQEMVAALQQADLVVARAGSSIFELEVLGKPAILVPLPTSAGNHQMINAKFLVKKKAATLLPQSEVTPARLVAEINKIMEAPEKRRQLAANMKALGKVNGKAAEHIADIVLTHV